MIFVTAFFLRPYAFWLAAGVATIIYGGCGWLLWFLWHRPYAWAPWAAGALAVLIAFSAWKYLRILNQEIESAESLECEALLWVMRIPGLGGRGLYAASHLGAGILVFVGLAAPAHFVGAPDLVSLPIAFGFAVWAIAFRLRHHPIASKHTVTGLVRG